MKNTTRWPVLPETMSMTGLATVMAVGLAVTALSAPAIADGDPTAKPAAPGLRTLGMRGPNDVMVDYSVLDSLARAPRLLIPQSGTSSGASAMDAPIVLRPPAGVAPTLTPPGRSASVVKLTPPPGMRMAALPKPAEAKPAAPIQTAKVEEPAPKVVTPPPAPAAASPAPAPKVTTPAPAPAPAAPAPAPAKAAAVSAPTVPVAAPKPTPAPVAPPAKAAAVTPAPTPAPAASPPAKTAAAPPPPTPAPAAAPKPAPTPAPAAATPPPAKAVVATPAPTTAPAPAAPASTTPSSTAAAKPAAPTTPPPAPAAAAPTTAAVTAPATPAPAAPGAPRNLLTPPPPAETQVAVLPPPAPAPAPTKVEDAKPAETQTAMAPPVTAPVATPASPDTFTISFAVGAPDVPADADDELKILAARMKADAALRVQLLAFASDPEKSVSRSRRLSLERAVNVRKQLLAAGIDSTRIEVRALGEQSGDGAPDRVDAITTRR